MILADKIIEERKKMGMSQEELAEKLSVSRQAVSKWESAQSVPDLQRVIQMSELFCVSTDYLLKDELEGADRPTIEGGNSDGTLRKVFMEEANEILGLMEKGSRKIAAAVQLCILCPVLLIFLAGLSDSGIWNITEAFAATVGMIVLFTMIAIAVFIFINHGAKTEKINFLKKEPFETAYGVSGLVKEKKTAFAPTYTLWLSVGIVLCIISPLPLIVTGIKEMPDYILTTMTALLLLIVSFGVYMIVRVSNVKDSYDMLLQEGDYEKPKKKENETLNQISVIYWCLATAVYLGWSFFTMDWRFTWIVWLVAGVLYAPLVAIARLCTKSED